MALRVLRIVVLYLVVFAIIEGVSSIPLRQLDARSLRIFDLSGTGSVGQIGVKRHFSQTWSELEFAVPVRTNNLGLREDEDLDPNGAHVDIGFFGDSFTFGHGVAVEERYSNRLKEHFPASKILSFSYLNGWTIPHYYVFLKKYPQFVPDIAVVGLFLGNDLTSDLGETGFVHDAAGDLVAVTPLSREVSPKGYWMTIDSNPVTRLIRRSSFGQLLVWSRVLPRLGIRPAFAEGINALTSLEFDRGQLRETHRAGLGYLLDMKRFLEQRGKRLVVLLIPWSFYVGDYPSHYDPATTEDLRSNQYLLRAVATWCRQSGVECVDPVPEFQARERAGTRLYFARDAHWNAHGHQAAADVIARYLKSTPVSR